MRVERDNGLEEPTRGDEQMNEGGRYGNMKL